MIRILIVDHKATASELRRNLGKQACEIITAETRSEALMLLKDEEVDVVIIGTKLPAGGDGMALLRKLKVLYPSTEVIMLIGPGSIGAAVRSMKLGAYDCITKPVNVSEISVAVQSAYESRCVSERRRILDNNESKEDIQANELVGESTQMREVKRLISLVGPSRLPVLILGETGTGKEVVARAMHRASDRSSHPFVAVNASALPEHILESELFGYRKGAFTGAESDKVGLLDIADQGTFFADEVGDMNPATQAKLLRVIETGTFRRLGDTREKKVNIRLLCATNKALERDVQRNDFRADLYYRLSTFIIHLPPLRERKDDIPLLVDHFLSKLARGDIPKRVSPEALRLLIDYPWPGNVRELANTLERAYLLSAADMEIQVDKLPPNIVNIEFAYALVGKRQGDDMILRLLDAEKEHIEHVLRATRGNKTQAAHVLGISRSKLYSRLEAGSGGGRPV